MQTIWRGTIAFGLVTIPVRLYAATSQHDLSFRQVHESDGGRIRYRRFCEEDGEEVAYADIRRAVELPDGLMLPISPDDLKDLPLPSSKQIAVLEFVPVEQVNPILFSRSYYLGTDGWGTKSYVLLREALERSGRYAVVKVAIRTKETLALLRVSSGVLVMQTLLWPDEVRDPAFARPDGAIEVRVGETRMAKTYIKALQTDFDPDRYRDEFRDALLELIEAKMHGHTPAAVAEGGSATVDLLGALKASVEVVRQRRTAPAQKQSVKSTTDRGTKTTAVKKSAPRKRAAAPPAAKKAAAKKAAAKKAAAAKTAGRRSPRAKSA